MVNGTIKAIYGMSLKKELNKFATSISCRKM